ncbi:response regulator [uncultured Jannaschia sp.]|uniref:response regulator n=1 Tax=uncultured Jannaschia sp. TaxID=293347 RepID=UPI00261F0BBB|nr:response regulator [uncultured Jannaschia sp.]
MSDVRPDTPLRVLIVEDEALIAFDLEAQIEDCGYEVTDIAQDVASCQAAARRVRPDVALMDYRLKNGDSGRDAATWLREELDVPCIFLSGNLDEATRALLGPLHPVAFVGKPLLPPALRAALEKADALRAGPD